MSIVVVIGTIHSEGGACTSEELLRIIDEISAETIFVEASKEKFPLMLDAVNTFNTPEINALREIVKRNSIKIEPIDLDNDPFDNRLEVMQSLFPKYIKEYYYASQIQRNGCCDLGFKYLNGKDSDQINYDKSIMERRFVERVNNLKLSETYSDWLRWNDERENHWIRSIHRFLSSNKLTKAVFLVGSAHRIRLMEKVRNLTSENESIAEWDFYYFD